MFTRNVLAATILGAIAASAALGQATPNANVPRADYIATMDIEFRKMDADKNGQVTRAEAEAYERATALAQARTRNQALFAQLDKDRNGQLSLSEFGALNAGTPPVDARPLIAKLDTNKDGQISLIEHRAGKLGYFDQIDTDKDGIVTVAEMRAAGVIK